MHSGCITGTNFSFNSRDCKIEGCACKLGGLELSSKLSYGMITIRGTRGNTLSRAHLHPQDQRTPLVWGGEFKRTFFSVVKEDLCHPRA